MVPVVLVSMCIIRSGAQASVVFANMPALGSVFGVVTWWQQALEGNCSAAQTVILAM